MTNVQRTVNSLKAWSKANWGQCRICCYLDWSLDQFLVVVKSMKLINFEHFCNAKLKHFLKNLANNFIYDLGIILKAYRNVCILWLPFNTFFFFFFFRDPILHVFSKVCCSYLSLVYLSFFYRSSDTCKTSDSWKIDTMCNDFFEIPH